MQDFHLQHKHLTAAEVSASKMHRLHQVKLFYPAICHITHGSKVIIHEDSRLVATPDALIIIPANTPMEIINQPAQGIFHSDLLLLSPEIIAEFKTRYLQSWPRSKTDSLCAPLSEGLAFMWGNLLHAVRHNFSDELQKHQAFGLLLALLHDGAGAAVHHDVPRPGMDRAGRCQSPGGQRADPAPTTTRRVPQLSPDCGGGAHGSCAVSVTINPPACRGDCLAVRVPFQFALYRPFPPALRLLTQNLTLIARP